MNALDTTSARGRSVPPEAHGGPYPLAFIRTGLILLAVLLRWLVLEPEGTALERALPVIDSLLAVWCLVHLAALARLYGAALGGRRWWLPHAQIAMDMVLALALIWCTGGVRSFFLPVLLGTTLCASTVFGMRPSLMIASSATITLTIMTVAEAMGWSPGRDLGLAAGQCPGSLAVSYLVWQGLALHGVAFLGARLAAGWRLALGLNDRIVANIGEGIVALDERGRLLLLNQEALRILDYPPELAWQGKTPSELFRRAEDAAFLHALENPQPGEHQVLWHLGRRERMPLSLRIGRLPGAGRAPGGWLVVLRDLTVQRRATAAEARLRQLQQLEDLALGLAHEVRNPLASIRGCVQELGRGALPQDQMQRLSAIVLRESDRLDRIVDEFLRYSRTTPTEQVPVDLAVCLREVVDTLSSRPDAAGVQMLVQCATDRASTLGHRELLYRLFLNLGINALEAMGGRGRLHMRLVAGEPDGWQIEVEDNGPGMSEAVRQRIFNPFFSTKPREGGLGLALVERIVHGHAGSIEVESEEGKGSRFRVWLPATGSARDSVDEATPAKVAS